MRSIMVAAVVALLVSILATPLAIRTFRRRGFGQEIRDDGPESHMSKRGTPTMGGAVILIATVLGYTVAHLVQVSWPSASGLLVMWLKLGLGAVGFLDDFIKIRKQRSLGLSARAKFIGQLFVGLSFAILALMFKNGRGLAPASVHLSFVRDIPQISFGVFGFLWWNASPARIFMGDTGSLALGGLMAGLAILTKTELLLVVLGGLFVVEALSVMLQVAVFKSRRSRLFNMAPIHHHFELAGWAETTVIVRFWIISGIAVAFGLGLFYAEFLSYGLQG